MMPKDLSTPEKELQDNIEALMASATFEERLQWACDFNFSTDYPTELQPQIDRIMDLITGINT